VLDDCGEVAGFQWVFWREKGADVPVEGWSGEVVHQQQAADSALALFGAAEVKAPGVAADTCRLLLCAFMANLAIRFQSSHRWRQSLTRRNEPEEQPAAFFS
jgi:hypothetical protein